MPEHQRRPILATGLHKLTPLELDAARQEATRTGAYIFALSTLEAHTRADFFERVRESLPLDPPLVGSESWDAFSDSLWGGIDALEGSTVAILWEGAEDFRRAAPDDFAAAMTVLRDVTASLDRWIDTGGEPKKVSVYVALRR